MTQSDSRQPDLNWSQVNETVKLLTVSASQVENSLQNGDASVNTLTESFTSLVSHMLAINENLSSLQQSTERDNALMHCAATQEKIQSSIIAFQFYDRLQQSLHHVVNGLQGLSKLVDSPERLYNPVEWSKFKNEIRERYTMESEKVMFDAIIQGKSIEEAIQLIASTEQDNDEDEIELF